MVRGWLSALVDDVAGESDEFGSECHWAYVLCLSA